LASSKQECFRYLKGLPFRGVVLMGTASAAHLRENIAAFDAA
jgi:aryl-alcohol dehydrogenase-like predicted oxidoreductase